MIRRFAVPILDRVPRGLAKRFVPGSPAAKLLAPLINVLLPRDAHLVTVRSGLGSGLRLLIEPTTEKYYWTGMHEPHVQRALVDYLRPGATFWDVGAHVGFMSLIAARAVGDTGSVVAFEPMPVTQRRLRGSISAMGITNVSVEPMALTSSPGTQTLHSAVASTMWSLTPNHQEQEGVNVRCSTLDIMLESHREPDLVKIDAEGAEVEVLRGGSRLIEEHRPALLVEFSSSALLEEGRELLGDHQYRWTHIGANHWLLTPGSRSDRPRH